MASAPLRGVLSALPGPVTHGGVVIKAMTERGDEPESTGDLMSDEFEFDIIVIGSGAGGGTLAHTLAPSG
jgi:hypothetical protein